MSTTDGKYEWDANLIGVFDPSESSNCCQTHDVHPFIDQAAYMAPIIGLQKARDNLHTCLRGNALK